MTTVFFLLDAFRHDYLSERYTPFLWECAQKGRHYQRVVPGLGFCERSEILSGLKANESGFFTAIGYDPDDSPFKKFNCVLWLEPYWPKALKWIIRRFSNKMGFYEIPLPLMPYWNLTEDKIDHRSKEAFPSQTILSLLENNDKGYFYDSFTALTLSSNGSDQDRMQMALRAAENLNRELFLIYVSSPDLYGHKYGPDSDELRRSLIRIDKDLSDFSKEFAKQRLDSNYVFLGDHGMVPVSSSIDAGSELFLLAKKLSLRLKRDFIYFLDSTLMRIWFLSEKAEAFLERALRETPLFLKNGLFVNESFAKQFNIPWRDKRYGDVIWLANPGNLIFPDFFHRTKPCKGMHGFNPDIPDSQGTCIVYGQAIPKEEINSISLTQIFYILKDLLGV